VITSIAPIGQVLTVAYRVSNGPSTPCQGPARRQPTNEIVLLSRIANP
jgi:hypothetical protein